MMEGRVDFIIAGPQAKPSSSTTISSPFHRPFAVHFTFGGKRNVDGKKEMSCELGLEQDLPEQRFV